MRTSNVKCNKNSFEVIEITYLNFYIIFLPISQKAQLKDTSNITVGDYYLVPHVVTLQ
jgi:hypothetical protein